jgi:hypothetical protein
MVNCKAVARRRRQRLRRRHNNQIKEEDGGGVVGAVGGGSASVECGAAVTCSPCWGVGGLERNNQPLMGEAKAGGGCGAAG